MNVRLPVLVLPLAALMLHCGGVAPHRLPEPPQPGGPGGGLLAEAWPEARRQAVLDKTLSVRLAPSLDGLRPGERAAVQELLEVGRIMQALYEDALHPQARAAAERLAADGNGTADLRTLYRLFQGPVATTLENAREPFVGVAPEAPGKNVYPWNITREEVNAFLQAHPDARDAILGERTAVRRATRENLRRDRETLERHPALAVLHPGLQARLEALAARPSPAVLYAVPYAVAWADELTAAQRHLFAAAERVASEDAELARYLRNRGRDLLTNDYESGDASWVTGRFVHLNAQIGAYETYDDALFGVKAFPSFSLLLRDGAATGELQRALGGLQELEDALPYTPHKQVRSDVPVGVYQVVADFGQARGTNTATILPNDPLFSRRYGRTILLRHNVMTHPELFAIARRSWQAVVGRAHADDLGPEGDFHRTLWHEVGHYLGADRTHDGRLLDQALQGQASALEEMKSDLVALFALHRFHAQGLVDADRLRAVQASGVLRSLQNVRPRPDQPYQIMQLAQFNYFREHGLLEIDSDGLLVVKYARYPEVVEALLGEVLALQLAGDPARAEAFFQRWTTWTGEEHERLAERIRQAQGPRYRLVRYGALGE